MEAHRPAPFSAPDNLGPRMQAAAQREQRTASAQAPWPLAMPGLAAWLLLIVGACVVFASFSGGATTVHDESRIQVALALAVALAGAGLYRGTLGTAAAPTAWRAAALFAGFAIFCALSVVWSIAPDLSWIATNRAAEYAAVVAVLLVAAPSVRRAPELAALAYLAFALVVAAYALGGKVLPEVSLGPVDFDHASTFARLREPLGYWNSLGLFMVMATPICVWIAADRRRPPGLRLGAMIGLDLLIVTIALTYSRGAVLAAAVAIAVIVGAGPSRLRRLGVTALGLLAAVAPVAFAFGSEKLSSDGVAAADRTREGLVLLALLGGSMLVLAAFWFYVMRTEPQRRRSKARRRGLWRLIAALAVLAAFAGLGALAVSDRGIGGSVSHQWDEFRKPAGIGNSPSRLVSANGSNRWIWWREAVGEFSDRPLAGWGAGAFPLLHDLYREYPTQVRSAHNVPLQFLAEGGLIGAALAIAAVALLFAAAVGAAREASGRDRAARVVLIAAASAWAAHCLVDWDWEIPAVAIPALGALAIAAAPPGASRDWTFPAARRTSSGRRLRTRVRRGRLAAPIAIAAALVAVAFIASALLPAISEDKRLAALSEAGEGGSDPARLERALDDAKLAARLNPLSPEPLFTEALLEIRRNHYEAAHDALFDAARIEPDNYRVWDGLLALSLRASDPALGSLAVKRRLAAEPLGFKDRPDAPGIVYLFDVPAQLSPTAPGAPAEVAAPPAAPAP